MRAIVVFLVLWLVHGVLPAQSLQPGFRKSEYIDLMKISAQFGGPDYRAAIPVPGQYRMIYQSEVVGLENMWQLWMGPGDLAIVSIRGTTEKSESWLANLYAAMVPAKGTLRIGDDRVFDYELAGHPQAAVHVGWLLSTAYLSPEIIGKIDSCYKAGVRDILVTGHSQGGAIAYLLTAYLYQQQREGRLPGDIRFKTYCSAAPKPGNLYFAYEYEAITQAGWSFTVVNTADWVPEVPVSIQTIDDFNALNPFTGIKDMISQQKFATRVALNYAYKKLYKPTRTAQRNYQRILGDYTSKSVSKLLPGFEPPAYYNSNHYVRTGTTIVLLADGTYMTWNKAAADSTQVFAHHFHGAYLYLAERLNFNSSYEPVSTGAERGLEGIWKLEYIHTDGHQALNTLYPGERPSLRFDTGSGSVSGHTGCNSFHGPFNADGQKIDFSAPMAMTKMMCPGGGEQTFLDRLTQVNRFQLSGDTLRLQKGDQTLMQYKRG